MWYNSDTLMHTMWCTPCRYTPCTPCTISFWFNEKRFHLLYASDIRQKPLHLWWSATWVLYSLGVLSCFILGYPVQNTLGMQLHFLVVFSIQTRRGRPHWEQTLHHLASPLCPIGKIHPFSKIAVTLEPVMRFWCPSRFRNSWFVSLCKPSCCA